MKKFGVGVLSVMLMLFGCVFLSSCGSKVSLTCDVDSVEIYTNDENSSSNYLSADVSFLLENGTSGAYVEVTDGKGLVTVSSATQKSDGTYFFTITATCEGSGEASVKITSRDDTTKTHSIAVYVKTKVTGVEVKSESTSSKYVVKGEKGSAVGTELASDTFLDFEPASANVADVTWEIVSTNSVYVASGDGQQLMLASGNNAESVVAEILDGKLFVYSASSTVDDVKYAAYGLEEITIQATCNGSLSTTIEFKVISDSSIVTLTAENRSSGESELISSGEVQSASAAYDIKFNGETSDMTVSGTLTVQTSYDNLSFALAVYRVSGSTLTYLGDEESQKFLLQLSSKTTTDSSDNSYITYTYTLSVEDISSDSAATYAVFFEVQYEGLNYSVSTKPKGKYGEDGVRVLLNAAYKVTSIELSHSENGTENTINNETINVYSSYSVTGYLISTLLLPYDVELDNNTYSIQVDVSASGENAALAKILEENSSLSLSNFVTFICNGRTLSFTKSGDVYSCTSSNLVSGSVVYVVANNSIPTSTLSYDGLKVDFVSNSDANRSTYVYMNLFSITSSGTLDTKLADADDLYVSSSSVDSGSSTVTMRVYGITSSTGLTVEAETNSHFSFSSVSQIGLSGSDENGTYVDISFTVTLSGTNFEDDVDFVLSHVTGKTSDTYTIIAFVPLTSASIVNASSTSAGVYDNQTASQGFYLSDDTILDSSTTDSTLSRVYVEAGTALSLTMTYQTLAQNGVTFAFLLDDDKLYVDDSNSTAIEKLVADYATILKSGLTTDFSNYLTITTTRLTVTSQQFRGFVFAYFTGYDSSHQSITRVRIFEIVSFFGVDYLSSSVKAKSLNTLETLSEKDADAASVSVTISFRLDGVMPSHLESTNIAKYFTFTSSTLGAFTLSGSVYSNGFYQISSISLGSTLTFKITALSTFGKGAVTDRLTIEYDDSAYGITRSTYISLSITDVVRVEEVEWTNETEDGEIYMNLTSGDAADLTASIATTVAPSSASNTALTYYYSVSSGSASSLSISTNDAGNVFTLQVASGTQYGSVGTLYILPQDMVKTVDGVSQAIYYTFVDADGDGEWDEDDDAEILTARYVKLSELGSIYESLVGDECVEVTDDEGTTYRIANFFVNLDGEKIYYSDLLLAINVTLADGQSEEKAVRIYTASQFKAIDTTWFCEIMNDITLSEWSGFSSGSTTLTGMIFGNTSSVTITLSNAKQSLFSEIKSDGEREGSGTIKNITFVGDVTSSSSVAGFVVGTNRGTISGVTIDVQPTSNNSYSASTLTCTVDDATVGGIAGINYGTISGSYVLGMTIAATSATYTGGLVGENRGTISGCGVEFYNFATQSDSYSGNKISGGEYVGGIVGHLISSSTLTQSYAYAHVLANTTYNDYTSIITDNDKNENVGLFAGMAETGASASESFAFLGTLESLSGEYGETNGEMTLRNGYYSYYSGAFKTMIFDEDGESEPLTKDSSTPTKTLSSTIWATGSNIDSNVNFGFVHLANVCQTLEVDVQSLSLCDVTSQNGNYQKLLKIDGSSGILFNYKVKTATSTSSQSSALTALNTISISDMFSLSSSALTERQARALVISSSVSNITVSTTTIQINSVKTTVFTLSVLSKVDMTNQTTFSFVILDSMPTISASMSGETISDGQTLLLQKGSTNNIAIGLDNTIYLNGTAFESSSESYKLEQGSLVNSDSSQNAYISAYLSGQNLIVSGLLAHENSAYTTTNVHLVSTATITNNDASSDFTQSAINNKISSTEKVDTSFIVYNGATALLLSGVSSASLKPSQSLSFSAILVTDSSSDNLTMSLTYEGVSVEQTSLTDNLATFEVDDELTLQVAWIATEEYDGTQTTYRVVVQVVDASLPLLTQAYENLVLTITAQTNTSCSQNVEFSITTQEVEDVNVYAYSISKRLVRSSKTYYQMSTKTINSISPASDAILAVLVTPSYAQMDYFTITYTTSSSGGLILTRLTENSLYGFYATSSNVTSLSNGIQVKISDSDRAGTGIYYFRLYVLSTFSTDSDVELTVTFYRNGEAVEMCTYDLAVDYLASATVLVDGDTTALVAKGSTATITISVDVDTTIGNPYLQNAAGGISITNVEETVTSSTRTITATLQVDVDAKLNTSDTGVFYVSATVTRTMNGVVETKTASATVYLVDFVLASDGVELSTDTTYTYGGTTYDAYIMYVGATGQLSFDYTFSPESYTSGSTVSEIAAIEKLTALREDFESTGNYADSSANYYINYSKDSTTGEMKALSIAQTLSYVDDNGTHALYNSETGAIKQPSNCFTLESGEVSNALTITANATTGSSPQLMKMTITIYVEDTIFEYYYYFLIVVQSWTDEENPTAITSQAEFEAMVNGEYDSTDFILMNDIVLTDYTPASTTCIDTFDGNGYVIHLNSFAEQDSDSVSYALFDEVTSNTTLKNMKVNVYEGGQISIDYSTQKTSYVAGFAITNNGIIYNCEVVSYKSSSQTTTYATNGIVVQYTNGSGTDAVTFNDSTLSGVTTKVAGFVINNNSSITNSRVGGDELEVVEVIGSAYYLSTVTLGTFTITGQSDVAGFVSENTGAISACFAKNVQINNMTESTSATASGFVTSNTGTILASYVEGVFSEDGPIAAGSSISAFGIVGGFVYSNNGTIKNAYSNIAITYENEDGTTGAPTYVAGFVYRNEDGATISTCYTACQIDASDSNQMYFSGISTSSGVTSQNFGTITNSYYLSTSDTSSSTQTKITTGVQAVSANDINNADENLYGFSFTSQDSDKDGIWVMNEHGITLASANNIAFSNRYSVTLSNGKVNFYYNTSLINARTLRTVNVALGSEKNPIILRSAEEFAKATGKATDVEISAYANYYNATSVWGAYRLVSDIDMSEIDQNQSGDSSVKLTTMNKTFTGTLDGNGFTISNIDLGGEIEETAAAEESYGLFEKLNGAVIMNINFTVNSVRNGKAYVVGTLAGIAVDTRLVEISLSLVDPPSDGSDDSGSSSGSEDAYKGIFGANIVGGVVGILYGDSVMVNVQASDVMVYSSYYDQNASASSYEDNVENLLNALSSSSINANTSDYVKYMSYAGTLVGFLSTNRVESSVGSSYSYTTYSEKYTIADYSIVSVKVTGTISVYGEIVGGLFGYVGETTYIYDASLELDADTSSYITSKNLYAGGIVGESYGALFGVYAQYEEEEQDEIEEGETSYYSGSSVNRGQEDIFSHKRDNDDDMAQYIGGLAGYVGAGFISTSYSKLNVISSSADAADGTAVAGGIAGLVGSNSNSYTLEYARSQPTVNVLFLEVYASGDVWSATGESGGIIGEVNNSVVAMQNVMAMNYYSYSSTTTLSGDSEVAVTRDTADGSTEILTYMKNHSAIVGKGVEVSTFYVLSADDEVNDIVSSKEWLTSSVTYTTTVGGYNSVTIGSNTIYMRMFGFENYFEGASWNGSTSTEIYYKDATENAGTQISSVNYEDASDGIAYAVLIAQNISTLGSLAGAYVQFSNYFLDNGWSASNWTHTQNELFPHLDLSKSLAETVYWDATVESTKEVLDKVSANPNIEIIVRGRTSNTEYGSGYADINVTALVTAAAASDSNYESYYKNLTDNGYLFSDFSGTIVSFSEYTSGTLGVVNSTSYTVDGYTFNNGSAGAVVDNNTTNFSGLILTTSLFGAFSGSIESMNIYFCSGDDLIDSSGNAFSSYTSETTKTGITSFTMTLSSSATIGYSLVSNSGGTNEAEFSGDNFVLNHDVSYTGSSSTTFAAGLLGDTAKSVSIFEVTLTPRTYSESVATTSTNFTFTTADVTSATNNIGLLFGSITQASATDTMYLNNITIDGTVTMNVEGSGSDALIYIGSVAGQVTKDSGAQKIYAYIGSADNLTINVNATASQLYVGGSYGSAASIDQISAGSTSSSTGVTINLKANVSEALYAGLAFGEISSGSAAFLNETVYLSGTIYQNLSTFSATKSYIGGFAGSSSGVYSIVSINTNLTVLASASTSYDFFSKNWTSFSGYLTGFSTSGDVYVGGIFGVLEGATPTIESATVSGTIEIYQRGIDKTNAPIVAVGGLIGLATCDVTVTGSVSNTQNVSVDSASGKAVSAYIGGIIGWTNGASKVTIGDTDTYKVSGNTLANVSNLKFGGAIGYVQMTSVETAVEINNFVHSGNLRIWGTAWAASNNLTSGTYIYAGGVIGMSDSNSSYSSTISDCLTYGDVFVIYDSSSGEPDAYYFGGIMAEGTGYNIEGCVSLMSNFNSGYVAGLTNYYVGAITGGSDENKYGQQAGGTENYYSSSVCMTYQSGSNIDSAGNVKNVDLFYGTSSEAEKSGFVGYFLASSSSANYSSEYETIEGYSNVGILDKLSSFGVSANGNDGTKLNPIKINSDLVGIDADGTAYIKDSYSSLNAYISSLKLSASITWVAVTSDLEYLYSTTTSGDTKTSTETLFTDLSNAVLVGNGFTLSITDSRAISSGTYYGGVANTMGSASVKNDDNVSIYNFQAISALVVEFTEDTCADISSSAYGGLVGLTGDGSIVYGVSVSGELSVGGTSALNLSGIVGNLQSGMITDSYCDANITYRAATGGSVSVIAYSEAEKIAGSAIGVQTIKNTYASGMVTDYMDVQIYTFASQSTTVLKVIDSYTITQTSFVDISSGATVASKGHSDATLNATVTTLNFVSSADSVSYSSTSIVAYQNMVADGVSTDPATYYTWEYAPFVNYGYASHPIGWLKNLTAYVQSQTNVATASAGSSQVNEYSYLHEYTIEQDTTIYELTYSDVMENFLGESTSLNGISLVLGVFNLAKFEDMIATLSDELATTKYTKFVLEYNLDMATFTSYGKTLGSEDVAIYIDGNNRTLDFASASASTLFGTVYGTIENLRISDILVTGNATLASTVTGENSKIQNITVTGTLKVTSSTPAGGVVATLTNGAKAIGIESLVNVTGDSGSYIIGGVFGKVSGGASVAYSSSSGQVISTGSDSSSDPFKAYKQDWTTSSGTSSINGYEYDDVDVYAIAGGVVGYLDGGTVTNSYNAGSVLANYTNTSIATSIAGGIVGYAVENSNGSTTTKISNCVNVALVGAGNYSDTGYSVSGGIFGYGYELATGSVSSCVNDGAVQAIGAQGSTQGQDWEISVQGPIFADVSVGDEFAASTYSYSISGAASSHLTSYYVETNGNNKVTKTYQTYRTNMDYYAYLVGTLKYYYTLKYNKDDYRHVYAFGIGYVYSSESGVTKDCATSTDNIENDGNIGEFWVTQTMTFDRQAVLDNGNGDLDFWGKFNVGTTYDSSSDSVKTNVGTDGYTVSGSGGYYISGYDSYGFPVRIYNTDTISRIYMYTSAASSDKYVRLTYNNSSWAFSYTISNSCQPWVNDVYDAYYESSGGDTGYYGYVMYLGELTSESSENALTYAVGGQYNEESNLISSSTGLVNSISATYNYYKLTDDAIDASTINSMWEDILMEDTSTYYSSVNFDTASAGSSLYGYDYLLSTGAGSGLTVFNSYTESGQSTATKSAGDVTQGSQDATANSTIEAIDAKLESSTATKYLTVGGQSVAIAYSSNGLLSAIAPYEYQITYTIGTGLSISGVSVKSSSTTIAASTWEYDSDVGILSVDAYCYNAVSEGDFIVSYYSETTGTVTLGNNNVTISGSDLVIDFEDNDYYSGKYDAWLDKLSSITTSSDSNFPNAKITTITLTDSDGKEYSIYDYFAGDSSSVFNFDTKTLQLSLYDVISTENDTTTLLSSSGTELLTISTQTDQAGIETTTFDGMTLTIGVTEVSALYDAASVVLSTKTDENSVSTTAQQITTTTTLASSSYIYSFSNVIDYVALVGQYLDMSLFTKEYSPVVFGIEGVFSVSYDGTDYVLYDGSGIVASSVKITDGSYVYVLTSDSNGVKVDAYAATAATAYDSSATYYYLNDSGEFSTVADASTMFKQATSSFVSSTTYYTESSGEYSAVNLASLFSQVTGDYDSTETYYLASIDEDVTTYTVVTDAASELFETPTEYVASATYYSIDGITITKVDSGVDATNYADYYIMKTCYTMADTQLYTLDVFYTLESSNYTYFYTKYLSSHSTSLDAYGQIVLSYGEISSTTTHNTISKSGYDLTIAFNYSTVLSKQTGETKLGYTFNGGVKVSTLTSIVLTPTDGYSSEFTYTLEFYKEETDSTATATISDTAISLNDSGETSATITIDSTYQSKYYSVTCTISKRIYTVESGVNGSTVTSSGYSYNTSQTPITIYGYTQVGTLTSGSLTEWTLTENTYSTTGTYVLYDSTNGVFYELSASSYSSAEDFQAHIVATAKAKNVTSGIVYSLTKDTEYTASAGSGLSYGIYTFSACTDAFDPDETYFKKSGSSYVYANPVADYYIYDEGSSAYVQAEEYDADETYYSKSGNTYTKVEVDVSSYYVYDEDSKTYVQAEEYDAYETYYSKSGDVYTEVNVSPIDVSDYYVGTSYFVDSSDEDVYKGINYYAISYSESVTSNLKHYEYYYEYRIYDDNTQMYIYIESAEDTTTTTIYIKANGSWTSYSQSYTEEETTSNNVTTTTYTYGAATKTEGVSIDPLTVKTKSDSSVVVFKFYVTYLDEDNIFFSETFSDYQYKDAASGTLVMTSKGGFGYVESQEKSYSVELFHCLTIDGETLTNTKTYTNLSSGRYKLSGSNSWTYAENGSMTIECSSYGRSTYEVVAYNLVSCSTITEVKDLSRNAGESVSTIILGDDIHMTLTFDTNTINIIGNGMFVKYTSETAGTKASLFGDNSATIKDLKVVAMVSLRTLTTDNTPSAVVEVPSATSDSKYLSVTTYGTIRNVAANASDSIYTISSGSIKLTGTTTSYVTIVGLDSKNSTSGVMVKLCDMASGFSGSGKAISHSIIIAGDGENGAYGTSSTDGSRTTATNGTAGGSVTLNSNVSSTSGGHSVSSSAYARAGTSGIGGFGGDGRNGFEFVTNPTSDTTVYNGGYSGSAGVSAKDVTLKDEKNEEVSSLTSRSVSSVKIYSGNTGIGRFWRVYWNSGTYNTEYGKLADNRYLALSTNYGSGFTSSTAVSAGMFYANGSSGTGGSTSDWVTWRIRQYVRTDKITYVTLFAGAGVSISTATSCYMCNDSRWQWRSYAKNQSYTENGETRTLYSYCQDLITKSSLSCANGASKVHIMMKGAGRSGWLDKPNRWRTSLWGEFSMGSFVAGTTQSTST